jgi:hypothetical protein
VDGGQWTVVSETACGFAECGRNSMLLFIDESGHNNSGTPYEVLAGVAIAENNLWNLVQAVRSAERDHFGGYLRELHPEEIKGRTLLKRKRFRSAARDTHIPDAELTELAHACLQKGVNARKQGKDKSDATEREIIAYSRQVLNFTHQVIDLAASFNVKVFASVVDVESPRPEPGLLRKDYVYLFERYFYFLEKLPSEERGLIVFDELEKSQSHILLQQMAAYFIGHQTGRYRSSRIVPEPFFVHSDLTTGVFLADLVAYILGWGWRLNRMTKSKREELEPYADKLHYMQFRGEKPNKSDNGVRPLFGIKYLDNLRGLSDRKKEETKM